MKRHAGFTLLEVLVALAVLAIAMGAVIKVSASNSSNAAYLKEKTIAHWIAMNKVNELRLTDDWPSIGTKKDTEVMAGEEWRWQMKISKTDSKDVLRVDVQVEHIRELGGKATVTSTLSRLYK